MFNRLLMCIIYIVFAVSLHLLPNMSLAEVSSQGCAGGDFDNNCSLAELTVDPANYIQIGNIKFDEFVFIGGLFPRNADTTEIRVVPLGDGSKIPGFRLEPSEGNTDWLYEYCTPELFFIFNGNLQFKAHNNNNQIIAFVVDGNFESVWRSTDDFNDPIEGGILSGTISRYDKIDEVDVKLLERWFCEPPGSSPWLCGTSDAFPLWKYIPQKPEYKFETEFLVEGYVIDEENPFTCTVKAELKAIDHRVILTCDPNDPNPYPPDSDNDGIANACDNCPDVSNITQVDTDNDQIGDACDEVNDECVNTPDDIACPDDGLFCTGDEICDSVAGCVSTGDPCPEWMTCNEDTDTCDPSGQSVNGLPWLMLLLD